MLKISHITPQSETALIFYFEDAADASLAVEIADFAEQLRNSVRGIVESIPSTASLYVEFHILKTDAEQIERELRKRLESHTPILHSNELLELPVYYHPEVGPDLEALALSHQLSISEVIQIHSETVYNVASLGFAPGFAYLAGLDPRIATPRLSKPKIVAKGSLGIADEQTAIYPAASPGGWSIIGNCPQPLFDPSAEQITPFRVGMQVKFTPITRDQFLDLGGKL